MKTNSKCMYCGAELTSAGIFGVCVQCKNAGVDKQFESPPPYELSVSGGWICPRCGASHAPWVARCDCAPPSVTTTRYSTGTLIIKDDNDE